MKHSDTAQQVFAADSDPLLSEKQAAQILCVKPGTLSVWRSTKRYPDLRFAKIGSAIRYRKSDVERFIDGRSVGGTA